MQVDGHDGDHVLIAPPYTISEEELIFIVDTLVDALDAVMRMV